MRAAIYNPYLDTLGGGERYSMAFAKALSQNGYKVDVQWRNEKIKKILEERFGMDLRGIKVVKDTKKGDGYDFYFWVSDGSIPLLRARRNFLHFQFPFTGVSGRSLLNKMKLFRIEKVICNSYFTKSFVDEEYGCESIVIYPPVDVDKFKSKRKENMILYVGRFSQLEQAKNQDILVSAFKKLFKAGYKDWKLVLAGGVEVGVDDYIEKLKESAKLFPIEIIESPTLSQLKELYGKAKYFWSASGFGIDERKEPKKVEHFGITVVESMAAGCVPIVYNAGGHKEIIADDYNGYLWNNTRELLGKTKRLIKDTKLTKQISLEAKEGSKVYEYRRFEAEIYKILQK